MFKYFCLDAIMVNEKMFESRFRLFEGRFLCWN